MDSSSVGVPGGMSVFTKFQEEIRRTAAEVVDTHRHCDVSNTRKCDLYHDLIDIIERMASQVRDAERAPMICGHPAACGVDGFCTGCAMQTRLMAEAGRMP